MASVDARIVGAPDVRDRLARYGSLQREVVREHLNRATSLLVDPDSELEVAAAVNSYLFRYLRNEPLAGDGADTLAAGRGFCGNHVATMAEMLGLAGIDSRTAALLGVRLAGNHSVVEVRFSDGPRGIFDPTHGALFLDQGRPLGLEGLAGEPALVPRALWVDAGEKRTSADATVEPIASIAADYRRPGGSERAEHPVLAKWRDWIADNRGWGIAYSGREMLTTIEIEVGQIWGTMERQWNGEPWAELAAAHDESRRALPWAFLLGQDEMGYEIAHDFRLSGTRPGRHYVLELRAALVQGERPRLEVETSDGESSTISLRRLTPRRWLPRARVVRIPVRARGAEESVRVRARGYVVLQGIRLSPAD